MDEKLGDIADTDFPRDDAPTVPQVRESAPPPEWRQPGRRAMPRKKVSTTIYIEPEQLEMLKLLNERTKVPMAEYIREGIDLVLQKHADKLPGQLSLEGSSTPRRSAGNGGAPGAPTGSTG